MGLAETLEQLAGRNSQDPGGAAVGGPPGGRCSSVRIPPPTTRPAGCPAFRRGAAGVDPAGSEEGGRRPWPALPAGGRCDMIRTKDCGLPAATPEGSPAAMDLTAVDLNLLVV